MYAFHMKAYPHIFRVP